MGSIFNFVRRYILVLVGIVAWQLASLYIIPDFLLPSPYSVIEAIVGDFWIILNHAKFTLLEAFIGITIAIVLALVLSMIMDISKVLYDIFYYPIIIIQTIPTIALAPLLVIWLGYYMTPKVVLIVITGFFPILIALLDGYRSVDKDSIKLLEIMGANRKQIYMHVKLPASASFFFAGLKVSMSYALITAIVSEWIGGHYGLGVYMIRARNSFALDKMFAIILIVSILSLLLISILDQIRKRVK